MHKNVRKRLFEFTILTHSQCIVFSTEKNNHQLKNLIANLNVTQSNDSTLIVGGTNLPKIDWEAMSTLKDENSTEFTFIEAVKDELLTHVKEPTRLTGRDKASLLDVVMSDIVLKDQDTTLEAPIGKMTTSVSR